MKLRVSSQIGKTRIAALHLALPRTEASPVRLAIPQRETVINLKTAKALGLTVPATLLALADEVIE